MVIVIGESGVLTAHAHAPLHCRLLVFVMCIRMGAPGHQPWPVSSKVHRYTREEGWVEDLPDMTVGRYGHGCAAFTINQEQVRER